MEGKEKKGRVYSEGLNYVENVNERTNKRKRKTVLDAHNSSDFSSTEDTVRKITKDAYNVFVSPNSELIVTKASLKFSPKNMEIEHKEKKKRKNGLESPQSSELSNEYLSISQLARHENLEEVFRSGSFEVVPEWDIKSEKASSNSSSSKRKKSHQVENSPNASFVSSLSVASQSFDINNAQNLKPRKKKSKKGHVESVVDELSSDFPNIDNNVDTENTEPKKKKTKKKMQDEDKHKEKKSEESFIIPLSQIGVNSSTPIAQFKQQKHIVEWFKTSNFDSVPEGDLNSEKDLSHSSSEKTNIKESADNSFASTVIIQNKHLTSLENTLTSNDAEDLKLKEKKVRKKMKKGEDEGELSRNCSIIKDSVDTVDECTQSKRKKHKKKLRYEENLENTNKSKTDELDNEETTAINFSKEAEKTIDENSLTEKIQCTLIKTEEPLLKNGGSKRKRKSKICLSELSSNVKESSDTVEEHTKPKKRKHKKNLQDEGNQKNINKSMTNQSNNEETTEIDSCKKAEGISDWLKNEEEEISDSLKNEEEDSDDSFAEATLQKEISKKKKKSYENETSERKHQINDIQLLCKYEPKKIKEAQRIRRRYSIKVEKTGESMEINHEVKPIPAESLDMPLKAALEDIKNKSKLSNEESQILGSLNIILPWPVAPLHTVETRITNRPTAKQKKIIEDLEVKIKSGNFSKMEDEQIRKNWEEFYKSHDLPEDPTLFLSFADAEGHVAMPARERIQFARYLAHGLNNRLLNAVYKRFKRLFLQQKCNLGKFTAKEDEIITRFIKETTSETPYADLAKLLNRDSLSIKKRCMRLIDQVKGQDAVVKWDRKRIEDLLNHFVDVAKVDDVSELKDRNVTSEEWKELSKRLKVPAYKLRHAWFNTIYPRAFIGKSFQYAPFKKKLVEILIKRGEDDWRSVNWNEIAKDFEGFTGLKLNKMLKSILEYHVPKHLQKDLKECLTYLNENVLKEETFRKRKVRRLKIVDTRSESM